MTEILQLVVTVVIGGAALVLMNKQVSCLRSITAKLSEEKPTPQIKLNTSSSAAPIDPNLWEVVHFPNGHLQHGSWVRKDSEAWHSLIRSPRIMLRCMTGETVGGRDV